jgi:hypothetical protein
MPIEVLVPIAIFVGGIVISHLTSGAALRLMEANKSK